MANVRHRDMAHDMGFDSEKEKENQDNCVNKELQRRATREAWRQNIMNHSLYGFVTKGGLFKDLADGLLGILEEVGDLIAFGLGAIQIYFSASVVKSFRLTVVVTLVTLIDLLVGMIPVAGTIVDFFFGSNTITGNIIKHYVEDDTYNKKLNAIFILVVFGGLAVIGLLGWLIWTVVGNVIASF